MQVTVHFFARLRELAGRREWQADVAGGSTVADVWAAAVAAHPEIDALAASISCAVNTDFSERSTVVHEGDDVAFLPPVSGG
jgi:molybdopterin converting factor subunit 1